jgi:hypothetical protein
LDGRRSRFDMQLEARNASDDFVLWITERFSSFEDI